MAFKESLRARWRPPLARWVQHSVCSDCPNATPNRKEYVSGLEHACVSRWVATLARQTAAAHGEWWAALLREHNSALDLVCGHCGLMLPGRATAVSIEPHRSFV